MKKIKFFVYGTLKKGGYFSKKFDSRRISIEKAITMGTMFNIGNSYPAVLFDGKGTITGEIHEYSDEKEVLKNFDLIEGYDKEGYHNNLYNRKEIQVVTKNGNEVTCVAYEFNRLVLGLKTIKSVTWEI